MSGVTYKHSLRRHVPSGSHRRSETPSPPSTPTKPPSSPSSTQPHHSKRERVKEAVEHFFDKFHHHHHHHHHHGDEHGSQDDQQTASLPEKAGVEGAEKHSPLTSVLGAEDKKENVFDVVNIPSLPYNLESVSSLSLNHENVGSSGDREAVNEPQAISVSESPSRSDIPSLVPSAKADVDTVPSPLQEEDCRPEDTPVAPKPISSLEGNTVLTTVSSEPVEVEVDIPTKEPTAEPAEHETPLLAASSTDVTLVPNPSVREPEPEPNPLDRDLSLSAKMPTTLHEAQSAASESQASTTGEESHDSSIEDLEHLPLVAEDSQPATPDNSGVEKSAPFEQAVQAPLQTAAKPQAVLHEAKNMSYPPIVTPVSHDASTQTMPSYRDTPVTVPLYLGFRRVTVASRPKHSWFRYIYSSIVEPVVTIAVECTVAAVCYGLAKVLEVRPPAGLRDAESRIG